MLSFRKFLSAAALLVGAAILAPAQARADFEISVFVDGVNQNVTTSGTANSFFFIGSVSDFNIQVTSGTNWSGAPTGALMSNTSNNQVTTDFGAAGGTHTITIVISENGWTAPTSSLLQLSSSAGGSIGDTGGTLSVSATNQGFLDNTNTLATTATPGGSSTPLANASAALGATGTNPLVYNPSPANSIVPGGTPFSMTEVFSFTFTMGAGSGQDSADVSGSVSVAPVPVPPGFLLALTSLPALGVGAWFRRRRQAN